MSLNRLSNRIVQLAKIVPAAGASTRLSEDNASATFFVPFNEQLELVALIHTGALVGTVDAKWQQATSSTGTGAKDLLNPSVGVTSITTISVSEEVGKLELRQEQNTEQLDQANGFTFIGLSMTTSNAGDNASAEIVGGVYAFDEDGEGPQSNDQAAGNTARQIIA